MAGRSKERRTVEPAAEFPRPTPPDEAPSPLDSPPASPPAAPADPASAFFAEAEPHLDRLYRAARRLLGSPEDAADLVQETMLRAFRTWSSFRPGTDSRAWLFTILYSIFANRWQQRRRRPTEVSLQEIEERFDRELAGPSWEDPLERAQAGRYGAGEAVDAALATLPTELAAAVVLVDLEELSYAEAATAMSCPLGTVRSRVHRGRRLLAALLADHARENRLLPARNP